MPLTRLAAPRLNGTADMHTPRWKIVAYLLLILVGLVPTLPNFLPAEALSRLPASFAQSRITLGLDLRGGSHLVLEVDSAKLQEKARTEENTSERQSLMSISSAVLCLK